MITIENYKISGWEHAIMGMRNAKNSWARSDSDFYGTAVTHILDENGKPKEQFVQYDALNIGPNDHKLAMQLVKGGPVHAKFRRMIAVYVDITAPLYWWKEFDTYKVGTVANSCSTMHKIADKEFTLDDFSYEHLDDFESNIADVMGDLPTTTIAHDTGVYDTYSDSMFTQPLTPKEILEITIKSLNRNRENYILAKTKPMKEESKRAAVMKKYWWQMIQLLPSSYRQKRTIMFNYETLSNIYKWRRNHKLDEYHWDVICDWIEELPYSEFITGKTGNEDVYEYAFDYGECPGCGESIGMSGFVNVDECDSTNDVKLAIANDLENLHFSKLDPEEIIKYRMESLTEDDVSEECEACMIDFGEE